MLLNPYQLFAKNEITHNGYKLALIDVNIIRKFSNNMHDESSKNSVKNYFVQNCIRPVVSDFIFFELMKGYREADFKVFKEKLSFVSKFFDEINAIWICNQQEILAFEFLNIYKNTIGNAYKSYKIFCASPMTIIRSSELRPSPFYDSSESPPISTFLEYGEHLLKDLHNLPTPTHSKLIGKPKKDEITPIIKHYVPQQDTPKVVKAILSSLENPSFERDKAPMYFIQREFPHQYEQAEQYSEKINHTLDRWHLYIALSYCDYFITNDVKMKNRYKKYTESINKDLYLSDFPI